jgi:hypothetical protein
VGFLFLDIEIEESLVNGKDYLIYNFTMRWATSGLII